MRHKRASCTHRSGLRFTLAVVVLAALSLPMTAVPAASARVFGFHVQELPAAYADQERFFAQLKDSGADTLILDLPLNDQGQPDAAALPNLVYLVHQAKMRLFVIMQTRSLRAVLKQHPEWEDLHYDIAERSVARSGKADLYHPEVVAYLAHLAKVVASYSVDGILLSEDFRFDTGDGVSATALTAAQASVGEELSPKKLFDKVSRTPDGRIVHDPRGMFGKWTEAKRDRLAEVVEVLRTAARAANGNIKLGVSVPIDLPVSIPGDLLVRHAFDVNAYRKAGVDYYWATILHRSTTEGKRLPSGEGAEVLARSVHAVTSSVRDPERMIVVLQATSASGRLLSLSEIEDATAVVRNRADTGIAFSITPRAIPSATLTRKLFRKD